MAESGSSSEGSSSGTSTAPGEVPARLDLLKALGDNTRYAIYLELARSPVPLSTADIAAGLDLHVNTVRPHLERMRDVGLLQVTAEATGGVGRPQHRYSLAPEAPSLGLEPAAFPRLARLLARLAATAGIRDDEAVEIGREEGVVEAGRFRSGSCLDALEAEQATLGFDPTRVDDDTVTLAFAHCPYHEVARDHPEIVCGLHCGLVEGFVEEFGGAEIVEFRSLVHRNPCQVELVTSP